MPKRFKISDSDKLCDDLDDAVETSLRYSFGRRLPESLLQAILDDVSDAIGIRMAYTQSKIQRVKFKKPIIL